MQESALLRVPVPYRTSVGLRHKGRAGGAKARPASPRPDSRAFLNATIGDIPVPDTDILKVELANGYKELVGGLRRFYRMAHRPFTEPRRGNIGDRFVELLERAENDLEEMGLELCAWRIGEEETELNFTVFHHVGVLDGVVYIFYLSPCDVLTGELRRLYKQYIRFMADCFGTDITVDGCCNPYVDMVMSMLEDYPYDDEPEMEKRIYDFYNNGHGFDLFKEVNGLKVSPDELRRGLRDYRKIAEGDELELVEVMLDGMDILPHMSMELYGFNPFLDGFDTDDGYIDTCAHIAFVYNGNDCLEEMILDSINSDYNSGLASVGWNKWLNLDRFSREDFDFVTSDDSVQNRFVEWTHRWYKVEYKFDKDYEFD